MSKIKAYLYSLATDQRRGLVASALKAPLFILSLVYGSAVRSVILLKGRRPTRLKCKLISIGNLTLGGTGKTTAVCFVARHLAGQGRRVAVLSRGWAGAQNLSDEPRMLAAKLKSVPVIADTDRVRAAKQVIDKYAADTVLLDDGLQQWHIKKDLEIVTIDASCPFGNGALLPRGILRQPVSSLRKADIFIITKTDLYPDTRKIKEILSALSPSALIVEALHQPEGFYELGDHKRIIMPGQVCGRQAVLFSGIGDPASFEKLVGGLGFGIAASLRFADHHHYTAADLKKIRQTAIVHNTGLLITTEKDAARFHGMRTTEDDMRILVLRVELGFKNDDKERFLDRLGALYAF